MSKFDFIVRKWYVASCLALGLLSGMALTACGDDDPAPTPEVPDTPDTPDEPEGPTTSTVTSYVIQYFIPTKPCRAQVIPSAISRLSMSWLRLSKIP